jgi:glycosyltransferase involved in cell wall biosynthesis
MLKVAQHYKAKIYTTEYNKNSTFPEFKNLDVEVIGKRAVSGLIPYGRVAQGINYGLTFYNYKINDDYDVLNPHMAPAHWIRHNNERVLWYCHTPLRDVWDLYSYRMKLKSVYQKPVYAVGAKIVRAIDRSVIKEIESIVANSANTRSRLVKYFGRNDAKVLHGGIDYQLYKNRGDDRFFFYPSRMSPNKQQHIAIEAFVRFRKMIKKGKQYKLVLAGPVSTDKFYAEYCERVQSFAARVGNVEILTAVSDAKIKDLYSRCTAVLYPPINEDYGLVPLEAMASGKPVIAKNEGGPRETIEEKKTGFLVNDPEHMAKMMLWVVQNPALAEQMGKRGMSSVKAHYNWDRFFRAFDKELNRVKKMPATS